MSENVKNLVYISELREKLGFSPRKCVYKVINGEIVIYSINEEIKDFSA